MSELLNAAFGFDEVRWTTMRKTSYDSLLSFRDVPQKKVLPASTHLYRLVPLTTGPNFEAVWWMPEHVFTELHDDANQSRHGTGRLFRNYVAQALALPSGNSQLAVVEIELKRPIYAWVGVASSLFDRPGGVEQVYLPNLANRGTPRFSDHARLVRTYWLKF